MREMGVCSPRAVSVSALCLVWFVEYTGTHSYVWISRYRSAKYNEYLIRNNNNTHFDGGGETQHARRRQQHAAAVAWAGGAGDVAAP
jgi:hypothetical protein